MDGLTSRFLFDKKNEIKHKENLQNLHPKTDLPAKTILMQVL